MILEKNWYALLTRSRFENVVTDIVEKKSIEIFLPKIKVKSKRRDRHKMINVPLFPGYIFVKISLDPREQLQVLKTVGAVRLLGGPQGPVPVPETHIESLKIITGSGMDVFTGNTGPALKQGEPVMVINGPMAGARGEFMKYKGTGRVIIRIEALGQYAAVEIDEDDLEKVPPILS
ncbi:MAG: UpxY family transcription antiterminator [Desulfamplus sp.]|nr:UpxY family transcription antiterminator [Desulfamplus sp.]